MLFKVCTCIWKHNYEPAHNYYCRINGAIYFIMIFCIRHLVAVNGSVCWELLKRLCGVVSRLVSSFLVLCVVFKFGSVYTLYASSVCMSNAMENNASMMNDSNSQCSVSPTNRLAGECCLVGWLKRCDGFRCWFSHDSVVYAGGTAPHRTAHRVQTLTTLRTFNACFSAVITIIIFILLAEFGMLTIISYAWMPT